MKLTPGVRLQQGNCYVWKIKQSKDVVDLQPVTMFNAHQKYLTRCLLSPDTKYVRSGTPGCNATLSNHVRLVIFCRHLATCSADTTVKIWSTENYEYKLERVLTGHQRWVWDAAFSADSAYLVTGERSKEPWLDTPSS
jgi:G protein beta subunit-like protein